jgi:hypothetical protein
MDGWVEQYAPVPAVILFLNERQLPGLIVSNPRQ